MGPVEFQWLQESSSLKIALQDLLGCSGQQLKRYYSGKELSRQIRAKELYRLPLDLVNYLKINPVYEGPLPRILSETKEYLVIHKPPGVHCHPLQYSDSNTILNFLASNGFHEVLSVNKEHYDRGLLFRLDFETSGVLVLAKTIEYYEKMRSDFSVLMKRKFYWAIVKGSFNQEGEWSHFFSPSGQKGSKQKLSNTDSPGSRKGDFFVKKLMVSEGLSLVLVNLETGIRHQIRAQLSELGFPILGDVLYGGESADRIFLHAWRYESENILQDNEAELFDRFFDLNRAEQMSLDVIRIL